MKKIKIIALAVVVTAFFVLTGFSVAPLDSACNAKAALVMDAATGQVIYSKNTSDRLQIASMVKIMTLNVIFEEIENGNLSTDDMITASENAASMGGSQAFLDANSQYKSEELIKAIIVASANDACVALAEHISGSVDSFCSKMNAKAKEWGMNDTNFVNCTGLPAPNGYSCAADVAKMFNELIKHKSFFDYSQIWMFDFVHPSGRITQLTNTNKLVRFYEGCDGGKTGFTTEALSCLAATAIRGNTRFITVIIGSPSSKERNSEVSKLFNMSFANYETKQYVFKDLPLTELTVNGGKENTVKVCPSKDFFMLLKKGEEKNVEIKIDEKQVLDAPLKKGTSIGRLEVYCGDELLETIELVTMSDINRKTFIDIVDDFTKNW